MTALERRAHDRAMKRQQRRRRYLAACMGRATCPKRFGRYECGGLLELVVLHDGSTAIHCPRCERLRAGICLECPRPVAGAVGWSRRCLEHTRLEHGRRSSRRWRLHHPRDARRAWRTYHQRHKAARNAAARAWRLTHPDQVAAYAERYNAKRRAERAEASA